MWWGRNDAILVVLSRVFMTFDGSFTPSLVHQQMVGTTCRVLDTIYTRKQF